MIPREIPKQIRQIEIRTNRIVTEFAECGCVSLSWSVKRKYVLCLMLALGGLSSGCSASKQSVAIIPPSDREGIELPVKFRDYQEVFMFIAKHEGIPTNTDWLFKFAADSETRNYTLDEPPFHVWLIIPHFYNGGIYDKIRSAQGNGGYYVLRPLAGDFTSDNTDCGFELVRVAAGNTITWSGNNHRARFTTTWHVSAAESPADVYEWNGNFFEPVK